MRVRRGRSVRPPSAPACSCRSCRGPSCVPFSRQFESFLATLTARNSGCQFQPAETTTAMSLLGVLDAFQFFFGSVRVEKKCLAIDLAFGDLCQLADEIDHFVLEDGGAYLSL